MPGQRLSCAQHLGRARCHALIHDKFNNACTVDNITGCWKFTGSTNTDGYSQVFTKKNSDLNKTGKASQTAFTLHSVAFFAGKGTDPVGQVSHLCDCRCCFNPDHLVDESAVVNNSRKGCAGPIFCSIHGHLVVDLCPHNPRCIRGPRDDVNCCLALKESDPAWSSQTPQARYNSQTRPATSSSMASSLKQRSSNEYAGAEYLEEAVKQGLI